MLCREKSLISVVLLIVAISVSGCSPIPPETKESKLKKMRDSLVELKKEAELRRTALPDRNYESAYQDCLREKSLREEPRDCDKEKQESLEDRRQIFERADNRTNEKRREIKELEQSASTNEDSSK
jgi:hypothetical protein